MSTINEDTNNYASQTIYFGQCKWFNNKSGYGFISMSDTNDLENPSKDIFVHYTNINSKDTSSYKALQSGEYVQFNITDCNNSSSSTDDVETTIENNTNNNIPTNIREQAVNISGIYGGKLLNEYRNSMVKETTDDENNNRGYGYHGKGKGKGGGKGRGGKGGNRRFGGIPAPHNPSQKEEWTPTK
jgi:cold shock CspA family protein